MRKRERLLRTMCHDLAVYALKHVKGADHAEAQELSERIEKLITETQAGILRFEED